MCALFFLRFHGFGAVQRETLAKRLYLKIGWCFAACASACVFCLFEVVSLSVIVE